MGGNKRRRIFYRILSYSWGQKGIPKQDTKPVKENQTGLQESLKLPWEKMPLKDKGHN